MLKFALLLAALVLPTSVMAEQLIPANQPTYNVEWQGVPPRLIYGQRVRVQLAGLPANAPLAIQIDEMPDSRKEFMSTAAGTAEVTLTVPRPDETDASLQAQDVYLRLATATEVIALRPVRLTPAARWLQLLPYGGSDWLYKIELQDVDGDAKPANVEYTLFKIKRGFDWQQTKTGRWHYAPDFTQQRVASGQVPAGEVLVLEQPPAGRYTLALTHKTADGVTLTAKQILISAPQTETPDGPAAHHD